MMKFTLPLLLISLISFSISAQDDHGYTFVFLNKNPDAEKLSEQASAKIMEGHMANINKLASEKKLLAAGPFEGGGGIFILNTSSTDEATQWLSNDPGVMAKRWIIELLPYHADVGSVCTVSAPYEMVNYSFIRFRTSVTKFTAATYPTIFSDHKKFVAKLSSTEKIITAGTFGEHDGGILVVNGDVDESVLLADPGIQEGLLEYEKKMLYIAKGSFCETK
jgi:uncharacterized protein YciI